MSKRDLSVGVILLIVSVALLCVALSMPRQPNNDHDKRCWPIPPELAPGSIRCWSGGQLVYENSIYHNVGVLCSSEGKEIKITGGKSLCVIESNQNSSWEPPNEQLTPVP